MYRIVCKFVPGKRTPTGGAFGRWSVVACCKASDKSAAVLRPVLCLANLEPKLLVVSSPVPKQPNSWCSPRKILDGWLSHCRTERLLNALNKFAQVARAHLLGDSLWVSPLIPGSFIDVLPTHLQQIFQPLADPPYRSDEAYYKLGMYFPEYPIPLPHIIMHPDMPEAHPLHDVGGT